VTENTLVDVRKRKYKDISGTDKWRSSSWQWSDKPPPGQKAPERAEQTPPD